MALWRGGRRKQKRLKPVCLTVDVTGLNDAEVQSFSDYVAGLEGIRGYSASRIGQSLVFNYGFFVKENEERNIDEAIDHYFATNHPGLYAQAV